MNLLYCNNSIASLHKYFAETTLKIHWIFFLSGGVFQCKNLES